MFLRKSYFLYFCLIVLFALLIAVSAGIAADEKVVMKIASTGGTKSLRGEALRLFKSNVDNKSNGMIDVKLYMDKVLGSDEDNTTQLETNTVQAVFNGSMPHFSFYPAMRMEYYPFVFKDWDHLLRFYNSDFVKKIDERLIEEHNIRPLVVAVRGPRHLTANKLIRKPVDLKGIKLRTPAMDVVVSGWKSIGADVVGMPFNELFSALQQGVVDAQENPIDNIYSGGLYEVQDYISLTYHTYSSRVFYLNEQFWQSLTTKDKNIIRESAKEMIDFIRETIKKDDAEKLKKLKEEGMTMIEPDIEAFRSAFKENVATFPEEYQKGYNAIQALR